MLKFRVLPVLRATVTAGPGLSVAWASGAYQISLNPALGDAAYATVADIVAMAAGGGGGDGGPTSPQGRLTLATGTPVMTSSVSAAGTLYYTPHVGNNIWLYSGGSWVRLSFSETTIALSGGTASRPHDVFGYDNSGALALNLVAWTNDTTRATALARQDGFLVKSGDPTRLYLGSVCLDGAKQAQWTYGTAAAGGGEAKFDVWNMYNRRPVATRVADTTDSWTYSTAAWRAANGSSTMRVSYVCGLVEDALIVNYNGLAQHSASGVAACGVGHDSTTAFSGTVAYNQISNALGCPAQLMEMMKLGRRFVSAIEYTSGPTASYYGDIGVAYIQSGLNATMWM